MVIYTVTNLGLVNKYDVFSNTDTVVQSVHFCTVPVAGDVYLT